MFGQLTDDESRAFLNQHIYGRIGCHAFDKTYVVPISYAYHDGKIYGHTFDGLKVKMMRSNPAVCFQVDTLGDPANWKSVITQGVFTELEGEERTEALRILLSRKISPVVSETIKLSPDWPFTPADISEIPGIVFSITIEEISGRFEKSPAVLR